MVHYNVVGQAMALSKTLVLDEGLYRQSLDEAVRSLTSGTILLLSLF